MKGISPLVATVLLIAITMSIAGILAFWVASYTTQTLPKVNRTEEECRFSNFDLSCALNTTSGSIVVQLHNIGQYEIINLTAYVMLTDGTITSPIPLNGTLATGDYKSYIISNSTTNVSSTMFSKIIVSSLACSALSKDSTCTRRD
jgi:flagellin-like protein